MLDPNYPGGKNRAHRASLVVALLLLLLLCAPFARAGQTEVASKTVNGRLEISGSKIYYEECGSGPSAVVLLHDGLLHSVTWDAVWKPLCGRYHTVRYDRRGYGRSEAPKTSFTPSEDLYALLTHLKIEHAVVVGSSSGGALAIDFALAHPEMVDGLFLIGPVVDGMEVTPAFTGRREKNMAPLTNGDTKAAAENWSKDPYLIGEGHEGARKRVYDVLSENPQNLKYTGEFETRNSQPSNSRLGEIHAPTSIVVGEFDISDVHAHAGAIEAGIPGAERDIIINSGHLVQLEQPDVLMEKMVPFIDLQERKTVSVPLDLLHAYAGLYNAGRWVVTIGLEGSHLTMQIPGQAVFPLFAESQAKFFLKVADVEIEFGKDAKGKVSRAVIYQDGETIKAPRM
jgi:pimeloyl-ACP methyl ester carboxylesterase